MATEEERTQYQVKCHYCKGQGKITQMIPPHLVPPDKRRQGVPMITETCPVCNGAKEIVAYKALDALAQKLFRQSEEQKAQINPDYHQTIASTESTVLAVLVDTECSLCGKKNAIVKAIRLGTIIKAGQMGTHSSVDAQLCQECFEKSGLNEDMLVPGNKKSSIVVADDIPDGGDGLITLP